MRIIAGKHRSRKLETLEGNNTRPMMDVMKESVFNTIGPYFDEIEILDLFGGSGALSLESISRGAKHSYIIDLSKDAIKVITNNVKALKEENSVTILNTDYKIALKKLQGKQFDLIFLDPPYRLNIVNELLQHLDDNNFMKKGTIIVAHYVKGNAKIDENYKLLKNYARGTAEVAIYEKE